MGLFSLFRKSKQESASGDQPIRSRAAEPSATRGRGTRKPGKEGGAVDPVLPEKKRARRRLIGAIALVLAAVIGLPMILDSEPKPLASDIAIDIPARDQRPRPAAGATAAPARVAAAAALDKDEEVYEPAPVPRADAKAPSAQGPAERPAAPMPEVKALAVPAEKPALTKPDAKAQSGPAEKSSLSRPEKPEPKLEHKAEPKPAAVAAQKPAEAPSDAARARALLEGKPEPVADKAGDKHPGKFVVQVAALASRDKAAELQDRLKGAGIKSYTQKIATQGGERTRIRVGPFESREEAEKVRARLVRLGLSGSVVPV
jgi:DedD protein